MENLTKVSIISGVVEDVEKTTMFVTVRLRVGSFQFGVENEKELLFQNTESIKTTFPFLKKYKQEGKRVLCITLKQSCWPVIYAMLTEPDALDMEHIRSVTLLGALDEFLKRFEGPSNYIAELPSWVDPTRVTLE